MTDGGSIEELEALARRVDLVERLSVEPLHKADMVEEFDHSRSTIDRAIQELEDAGFVERVTPGYVATQAGQLAAARYREYLADQRSLLAARDVLTAIPHDASLPTERLVDADATVGTSSYRLFELLAEEMADADEYRVLLPALLDSRHLRLCHARVVRDDLAVTLLAPASVLEAVAGEFPHLWAELDDAGSFTARSADMPPYGLTVALDDGEATGVTLVGTDDDGVAGFVHSTHPDVRAWAMERCESVAADAGAVPDGLREGAAADLPPLTGDRLPAALRTEGFERIDDRYFERQEPLPPATAWRAKLDLPEVAAGYAVERTRSGGEDGGRADATGEGTSLSDDLLDRLRAGTNVALVGPPGAGKSTVCKTVAHRWYDGGGVVLYRESGRGEPFESVTALETALARTDGQVLVVVEDVVRPEASAVFEVMRRASGNDDVTFLLDARESEWRDPDEFPLDARLRAFRREAVDTVTMPALNEADCRRVVDRLETVTGTSLDVDPADLLADLRRTTWEDEETATPGLVTLLFHRLTRYLDPLTAGTETTLDEDVGRVRRDLTDLGETALEAGLLVNLLNVAGVGPAPAYVHAVGGDDPDAHEEVRAALDRLEGHVLFPTDGDSGPPYREVHDVWSVQFLERWLDEAGEAAARRRIGRCLTALCSLADDADLRARVARESDGETRALDPVVADPTGWADETVAAAFAVGRTYPKLAPMFGTTGETSLELPAACSPETPARCMEWRGRMWAAAGAMDRADSEFDGLAAAAGEFPAETADDMRLGSLLGHADVARRRGDTEAAAEHAREALALARETGARHELARARLLLGGTASDRGELGRGEEHLTASLDGFEDLEASRWVARTLDELGGVATARAAYDEAIDHFERSLETFRSVGDRRGEATALGNLGRVSNKRGDHEAARKNFLRGLDVARELGDRDQEAEFLKSLGETAASMGNYETAREQISRAIEAYEAVGDRHGVAKAHRALGTIAGKRDRFDRARDCFQEALAAYEAVGDRHGVARVHYNLGTVAGKQGDYDEARERYERALEGFEAIGNRHAHAGINNNLGKIAQEEGNYDEARERYERALEQYEAVGDRRGAARTHANLGKVANHRGDYARADEQFERAREGQEAVGDEHGLALTDRNRGAVAIARGEYDRAREHLDRALARHESMDARNGIARTHRHLAALERARGDYDAARDHCERGLATVESDDTPLDVARLTLERARIALARGNLEEARADAREAREALADAETAHERAATRQVLGTVAAECGDHAEGRDHLRAAVETFADIGAAPDALETLGTLVDCCRADGDDAAATEWCDRAAALLADAPDAVAAQHGEWVDRQRAELEPN